jgi:hypothetical protein
MKHDAKLYGYFRRYFVSNGLDLQELEDCIQEYYLSQLEGKALKQSYKYFILDYFIKQKQYVNSQRRKEGKSAILPLRFGSKIDLFGLARERYGFDLELLYRRVERLLRDNHKIILDMHLHGYSLVEIGKALGLTSSRVSQYLKEIQELFKRRAKERDA